MADKPQQDKQQNKDKAGPGPAHKDEPAQPEDTIESPGEGTPAQEWGERRETARDIASGGKE